ncbi:MAG: dihydrofolate reductase [Bacteroidetes bacterium]|nr:dihydrofolate reductase [Bacteroidota bacterium]
MRILKLQVQMTMDGFIAGPQGEMDWLNMNWTDDIKDYVTKITDPVDTILLGKNLAMGFIPYWTEAIKTQVEGSEKMVYTPKVVFSKTLKECLWERSSIASGELSSEIKKLKAQSGGDMIAYGGGQFVSSLIQENLLDELHLFINPVAIGKGMPIFCSINEKRQYRLMSATAFECGIVVLKYQPLINA